MIKTLVEAQKSDRMKFRIPRSVQESIPVSEMYADGIWHTGRRYSKSWRFSDINYLSAADDDRRTVIRNYGSLLSTLPTGAAVKLTIVNHRLNEDEFRRTMLLPMKDDDSDRFRGELNKLVTDVAAGSRHLVQEKLVTISVPDRKLDDARSFFHRQDIDLGKSFARLHSNLQSMTNHDRLRILHNFFRPGEEAQFTYDITAMAKRGMDFKDIICPDNLTFHRDYFEMGGRFGRVLFLREYGALTKALGGEVVEISPQSRLHINPLEVSAGYTGSEKEAIAMKTELITSIMVQHMGTSAISAQQISLIDRCTKNILQPYLRRRRKTAPTLMDWRKELLKQDCPEAHDLALAAELLTEGSLNVFAHASNVRTDSRILCYDLYEMGDQLRPTALVVTLDAIGNRVIANRAKGRYTWVFIDEVYLYFKFPYSAEVLRQAWKRFRKYGGILTAATQNVEECLASDMARLMFANSEFLLLFNQAASDQQALAKLLGISDTEMNYVTDAEPGHGLLRMNGSVVPFENRIPKDTELYRLMSTSPGEEK